MKTKTPLLPIVVLVLATVLGSIRSHGALTVSNGDFSNLSGLTNHGGGWYGGVPTGWSTLVVGPNYTVLNEVANLQTLGPTSPNFHPLYQDLGTTDSLTTITLSFDLSALTGGDYNVGVGIYNTTGANPTWAGVIAYSTYTTTGSYNLVATNVAAGTPITVAFWNPSGFAAAGLDNVSVIPEPRAALLGGIGLFVLLMKRRGIR
jgi:hypothetical protein